MISVMHSNVTIVRNTFSNNSDTIFFFRYCGVTLINSTFVYNEGNLIHARDKNTLKITGCKFWKNYIDIEKNADLFIIDVEKTDVSIVETEFIHNTAGFLISVIQSDAIIFKSSFCYNHGSAIYLKKCTIDIFNSVYDSNVAITSSVGDALTSHSSTINIHSSEMKNNSVISSSGGAISCFNGDLVVFNGTCTVADNHAEKGGAIYLGDNAQCFIAKGATVIIANNTALSDGGGIYLYYGAELTI